MYQCPKEGEVTLQTCRLAPGLEAQDCPSCGGVWIPPENYADWKQDKAADSPLHVAVLPLTVDGGFQTSPLDNRAALCPDCKHYLVRGRINLRTTSFYVERCPNCQGFWCDGGEWQILEKLQLVDRLEHIFSGDWQAQVRLLEQGEREKLATIEKLGPEVAHKIFELAELLEKHPNGDFGVAYLMRRFEE
ncbi:MAG TPA: zf-TFIIB domain-containing protein [Leptolyngbyaceae cyanobacterium]